MVTQVIKGRGSKRPFSVILKSRKKELRKRISASSVLEFLNNPWGLGTEYEEGCRTGPPG
jgi:hypothetical protein